MSAAPRLALEERIALPDDHARATLIGRAWVPGPLPGPSPVLIRDGDALDLSQVAPTCADLMNSDDPVALATTAVKSGRATPIGRVADMLANSAADRRDLSRAHFLSPVDLQAVRACGVTFIASMLERVIEEQAKGDPAAAESIRKSLGAEMGGELRAIRPGSPEAMRLKDSLIRRGMWSQYLEVGIGPDAEVFTKAQPLSAVGTGAEIGILATSRWNNPEPELVLVINSAGKVVGAMLGNDVNLRDFEGRSALLLGRAKDNNASCALGPFIRLLDQHYSVNELRRTEIRIEVVGTDGFRVEGKYSVTQISRDPLDLAAQTLNRDHQYPDGLALFLGTAFAPVQDRGEPGHGFTHKMGDVVTVRSPTLGALSNRINYCDRIAPWTFGACELMRNLSARGLI
ncbi:MAG TPA: fumarylacetoacetate hydrolase family protein [Burkholderiales bacterium]|nr:fumarylacetoacetate hydrolase family protein [Burkholderiales bacterium]